MARKKHGFVNGSFAHRRTESGYLGAMLDAVTIEDWRSIVVAAVDMAKAGDPGSRAWLAQYLIGRPGLVAPAPLTVVLQRLSGHDPLVDQLAKPYIERVLYPALHSNDGFRDEVKAQVADELRGLEAKPPALPNTGNPAAKPAT